MLVDGSFVTAKPDPDDVDAVMLVPASFPEQAQQGVEAALEFFDADSRRSCSRPRTKPCGGDGASSSAAPESQTGVARD